MRPILLLATLLAPFDGPTNSKPDPIAPGIRETQVTGMFVHDHTRTQFRATVIGKDGPRLTILTAAHCLGPAEVGSPIRFSRGDAALVGRVEAVVRNPNYRATPSGDVPGADNALALVRVEEGGTLPLDALKTAEMVSWPVPDFDGGIVTVQTIDQFEAPHVVKAGNFSNPRWLEWGPVYRPIPGDSGSGMFVVRASGDGSSQVLLIGPVVDRSDKGGGGSLVNRKDRWFDAATRPQPSAR